VHVSAGREPHSSPHTGLNTTRAAHSPAHMRWWARRAGRYSRRRTPGAWPSAVAARASSPPVGPSSAAPSVPSAGVGNSKVRDTRGLQARRSWSARRVGGGKRRPQVLASAGRRWGTAAAAAGAPRGRGHSEAGDQGLVVVRQRRCCSDVEITRNGSAHRDSARERATPTHRLGCLGRILRRPSA
jgi:hypothetical protein